MELQLGQIAKLPTYLNPDKPGYSYVTACEWNGKSNRCDRCVFASGPMHGYCQNYGEPKQTVGNCGCNGHMDSVIAGQGMRSDHKDVVFRKVGDNHSDAVLGVSPTSDMHVGVMTLGDATDWYRKNNKFCKNFARRFFSQEQIAAFDTDHRGRWNNGYSTMTIDEAKKLYNSGPQIRKKAALYFFTETELIKK